MDMGHVMPSSYMEHGFCLNWEKSLVFLHVGSDIVTGIAYYSIPIAMFYFAYRRRDLPFFKLFIMFAIFILSCGTTHLFSAYTIYRPEYWAEGYVKAFTAVVSALTAIILIPRIPEAIAFPSVMNSMSEIKKLNSELSLRNAELRKANFSIENVHEVIFWLSRDGRLMHVNEAACRALGYTTEEMLGFTVADLDPDFPIERWPAHWEELKGKGSVTLETRHRTKNGEILDVEVVANYLTYEGEEFNCAFIRDITLRKREEREREARESRMNSLYSISQYPYSNEQEFLDHALDEIITLTGSKFGYIYFYNEQSRQFTLNTWSKDVMRECSVPSPTTVYDLDSTGVWGEAVRQRKPILLNNFQADHPLKKGYPEGHVELTRFLTVPIVFEDAIVAVVGVANKQEEYGDEDAMQLHLFMDSVWMIAMRKRAEAELELSRKQYRNIVEGTADLITSVDFEGRLTFVNHASMNFYGLTPEECIGRRAFDFVHPDDKESTISVFNDWLKSGMESFTHENRQVTVNNQQHHHVIWNINAERDENGKITGFASIARDVTESRHSSEDKAKLEEQLQQTQKMDSVGRLAGGVAHDFNNMLGVILGHASLALMATNPTEPIHANLEEIRKAAERSADLTRQLLAFARKQTVAPKVLDLNETVTGMLNMLRRLIGENIELIWRPAEGLRPLKMDPSQIDQILANLCVNARDSITGIGTITIETGKSVIDDNYAKHNPESKPGEYTTLTVSDGGCGMDRETISHIFEPFFTTKGVGEGTGLGLSSVFGAVKQNNGFINVYSEPGLGTKFTIYLPPHLGSNGKPVTTPVRPAVQPPGGDETILLVEDEAAILDIGKSLLDTLGYTVLTANSPSEAIRLAEENSGKVHLLMTDVIMPEMNGRDLAERLQRRYPGLKCLFMSGYTANVIAHHGVLDDNVHFIQKPFSLIALAKTVREALDGK